jgi:TRAP-type C4-dicarboxylate transport system permease small subunit
VTRHPADLLSLVTGLAVLAVGLLLLSGGLDQVPMEWVGPAVAIGLGALILFAARPVREASDPGPDAGDEG